MGIFLFSFNYSFCSQSLLSFCWVIDIGSTHHICFTLSMFNFSSPTYNSFLMLPNGYTIPITHIGSVKLTTHITF